MILSIDTSTGVCSVALHTNGDLVATIEIHKEQSHGSKLAPMIDCILKELEVKTADLQGIVLAQGPGSYTGLRIGTSLAKGLCYSLDIPLVSVNTLELLAYQVSAFNVVRMHLCPMLDARRMEVYCQLFDADLDSLLPAHPHIVSANSFQDFLRANKVLFFGNGADKCKAVIVHPNAYFISGVNPSAAMLGKIGYLKLDQGRVENLGKYEPLYLKEFSAKEAKRYF